MKIDEKFGFEVVAFVARCQELLSNDDDGKRLVLLVNDIGFSLKWGDEAKRLEQERNLWMHEAEIVRKQLESEHETAITLFIEFHELKNAVAETLEENRHLADGDQCTLKKLKDAYAKAGASLDSENAEVSRGAGSAAPALK